MSYVTLHQETFLFFWKVTMLLLMLLEQIFCMSSSWFEPVWIVSSGRLLSWGTLFPQMSLEQQKK